jgi:Cu(I)/Ag(I) efflux system protein CusF
MSARIRYALVIALAGAGFSSFSQAQMDHSAHGAPATKPAMAMSEAPMEQGVVKRIDKATGKVAIAHEAQKGGMPAMTMIYKVKDTAALEKLQAGQKIRFTVDAADSGTLVRMEQVK